jgi:hypothetical protein
VRLPALIVLMFLLWALSALAEIEGASFTHNGETYVRLVARPGTGRAGSSERRLMDVAFHFALSEMERRGSITPAIRNQIEETEAPGESTGCVVLLKAKQRPGGEWEWGELQGVIRAEVGRLPLVKRLNTVRKGQEPVSEKALVSKYYYRWQIPKDPPVPMEAKNFVLRGGNAFAPLLIHSLIGEAMLPKVNVVFLETDLGALSELYVRSVGGFQYYRVFDESNGAEVRVPRTWGAGANPSQRTTWIRGQRGSDNRKYAAVLGADSFGMSVIRLRASLDPVVQAFRAEAKPLDLDASSLERFFAAHPPPCRSGYRQIAP